MPNAPDPKRPDTRVAIKDFGGFHPNADPHDISPGESIQQVNVTGGRKGELRVRLGYKALTFED